MEDTPTVHHERLIILGGVIRVPAATVCIELLGGLESWNLVAAWDT